MECRHQFCYKCIQSHFKLPFNLSYLSYAMVGNNVIPVYSIATHLPTKIQLIWGYFYTHTEERIVDVCKVQKKGKQLTVHIDFMLIILHVPIVIRSSNFT